jgi:hemerythrin
MMEELRWSPSESVGNTLIDQQHQRLIALCGQAADLHGLGDRDSLEQFHAILNDVFDAASEHFKLEESLLEKTAYPQLAEHQAEHAKYLEKLTNALIDASKGRGGPTLICDILSEWWLAHELVSDLEARHYFQST